jgi:Protein of unknown function (DUF2721)
VVSVATATQVIQLILAPVVMVSACAILVGGVLSHYQAVSDRVRALNAERFQIARGLRGAGGAAAPDPLVEERLAEIGHQLRDLVARLRLLRTAVVTIYAAAAVFIGCMIAIAVAVIVDSGSTAAGVLALFVLGTLVFLGGVLTAAVELTRSLQAVVWETERIEVLATGGSRGDRRER